MKLMPPGRAARLAPNSIAVLLIVFSFSSLTGWTVGCAGSSRPRGKPKIDASVMGDGEIPAVCGNGVVEEGEECDDGNRLDRDGCSSTCTVESCGASTCPNGCCDTQGECRKGSNDDTCGVGGESCEDCTAQGFFCQDFDCQALGDCEPGDTMECGNCGTRTCTSDRVWGACEGAGDCSPGQSEIIGACGNCGELERTCNTSCTWGSTTCINEGPCTPNDVEQGTSCGDCAVNERVCDPNTCQWGGWECISYGECSPGEIDDTGVECGNCGHEERTCTVDCNWGDWICTEEGDCQPGAHSSQGCGPCGTKTCTSQCTWGVCETPPEECNAIDDDCDGQTDEIFECIQGAQGTCNTSCNTEGVHTCSSSCSWGTCQPPSETCNAIDDDCDGETDEGHRFSYHNTTFTTLASYDSACDGTTERWGPNCNHAIHLFCDAQGCPQSGFGPVENINDDAAAVCIASVDIIQTTYTILSTHHPPCDGINSRMGQGCNAAFKRFCTSQGYVSGYGPVDENGDNATVVCLKSGTNVQTTYTELSTHHPPCDGTTQRVGLHCNAAINRYCASIGHSGGFGPIENNGDSCWVTCVYP